MRVAATAPSFENAVQLPFSVGDLSPLLPRMYDVVPGERFMTTVPKERDVKELQVVLNWFEDVRQRVAVK
jgi:hypothetical protein